MGAGKYKSTNKSASGTKRKRKRHNPHTHKRVKSKKTQEAPRVRAGHRANPKAEKLTARAKSKKEKQRRVKLITKS